MNAQCVVDPVCNASTRLVMARRNARARVVEPAIRLIFVNPGLQVAVIVFDFHALSGAASRGEIVSRGVLADDVGFLTEFDDRVGAGQFRGIRRVPVIHEHTADFNPAGQLVLTVDPRYPELLAPGFTS